MWAAYLVRTMTGQRGARLDIAAEGSWTYPAVGAEDWSVTVGKDQLRAIDADWWQPWQGSVLVCWETGSESIPWLMGPITEPLRETAETGTLTCKGLPALLEKRVVLARDYGQSETYPVESDMVWLARSTVELRGMSLGTIAQRVVHFATTPKLGGQLPIAYGTPQETGSTLNERTYEGYNLANISAWKLLQELSEVINGPDIQFRPEWVDESRTRLTWTMYNGTRAQPTIHQSWTMDLDTTSALAPVGSVDMSSDISGLTNRVYWTGAGEGAGTLIRMAQDVDALQDYMPLLETVGSTSDSESGSLVQNHAAAALRDGARPLQQLTITIDGSDPRCEIGRWRPGNLARVTIGGEWLTLKGGTRMLKIISAKGDWASSIVTLEFQEVPA